MKTAICCIVKNEQKFIVEWVDYHLFKVGFDSIYVFEDFTSDSHKGLFTDSKYDGRLFIHSLAEDSLGIDNTQDTRVQGNLYRKFLKRCKNEGVYDWVLFSDIDEFLMFEEGWNLERLCEAHAEWPCIWLSWKMYGACGRINSPHPKMGVLEAYPYSLNLRSDMNKWSIKSLVNVRLCEGLTTIHEGKGGHMTDGSHYNDNKDLCYKEAWINHYFTKSWEDFVERITKRGNMQNNYRNYDGFFAHNPDMLIHEKRLLKSVRYKHTVNTLWISRKYKLIAGGNENIINNLKSMK